MRHSLAMLLRRPGALTDPVIDEVTALLHLPDAGRAWRQLQRKEARWSGPATDLRTALGSVTCPAVLVSPEHDLVPPGDIRSAAKAMPRARFVTRSGAGHWLPRRPDRDRRRTHQSPSSGRQRRHIRRLSGRPLRPAELSRLTRTAVPPQPIYALPQADLLRFNQTTPPANAPHSSVQAFVGMLRMLRPYPIVWRVALPARRVLE